MKTYFVTGATGAIGAALVPLLLDKEDTRVYLLIRAKDQNHLESRFAGLLKFWGYSPNDPKIRNRLTALRGDTTLADFGLPPAIYQKIATECTHIIHSAGNVRMNLSIEDARKSSINSAQHIVILARLCQKKGNLEKVEFVSTVGVGGRLPGPVPEDWITEPRAFHNTYEQAKAEAELLIKTEIENALPVTVHRPSMVVGDSTSGKIVHFQIFYYLCDFLTGKHSFGFIPKIKNFKLDIVPVDYVAAAIRWSSENSSTAGSILHLCSGPNRAVEIEYLGARMRQLCRSHKMLIPPTHKIPLGLFKISATILSTLLPADLSKKLKVLPVYFDYISQQQFFSTEKTDQLLAKALTQHHYRIDDVIEPVLTHFLASQKTKKG